MEARCWTGAARHLGGSGAPWASLATGWVLLLVWEGRRCSVAAGCARGGGEGWPDPIWNGFSSGCCRGRRGLWQLGPAASGGCVCWWWSAVVVGLVRRIRPGPRRGQLVVAAASRAGGCACPRRLSCSELAGRRGLGRGLAWLLSRPWVAPRRLGRSTAAAAGMFRRRFVRGSLVSAFASSLHRPAVTSSKGCPSPSCGPSLVSRPVRQDRTRLTHGAAGLSSSRTWCRKTELVSRPVLQDGSMEASLAGLLGLGAGGCPGV
ncbi:uncharacterized protein LOC125543531 [Triticum urartu]|uniref:uncharacterized protein LOC125543531 n=1 Tax=Triticum urartu TaxID=4572 RepID=UPI002043E200|nr:uncharacterized protein LOC125543531 [Triticum urartu]